MALHLNGEKKKKFIEFRNRINAEIIIKYFIEYSVCVTRENKETHFFKSNIYNMKTHFSMR